MAVTHTSSAGRLLAEVNRVIPLLSAKGEAGLYQTVTVAFENEGRDWSQGIAAYQRLVDRTLLDLKNSEHPNPDRFIEAVQSVGALGRPVHYGGNTRSFISQFMTDLVLERLLNADEILQLRNHRESYDLDHATIAIDAINDILERLAAEPESEVRSFLEGRLSELKNVLQRYVLFGPEGVQDVVERIVGGLSLRHHLVSAVPPSMRAIVTDVYGVAKAAVEVAVWSKETYEAITWVRNKDRLEGRNSLGDLVALHSSVSFHRSEFTVKALIRRAWPDEGVFPVLQRPFCCLRFNFFGLAGRLGV